MLLLAAAWPQPQRWLSARKSEALQALVPLFRNGGGVLLCSADDTSILGFGGSKRIFEESASRTEDTSDKSIYELPAPEDKDSPSEDYRTTHKLEVGGPSLAMPDLGPIIVNTDGTLRRIENWSQLTKAEQASTIKMVTRRNKKRLDALNELEAEAEAETETEGEL